MRRRSLPLALLVLLIIATPVLAQGEPNPVDQFIQAVQAPENQEYISQFLRDPVAGKGALTDPVGDFGHSTGSPPGYTPDFIDITDTWALDLNAGEAPLFGPTDGTDSLWTVGNAHVDLPNGMPLHTYSIDSRPHDGSQYADGAYLFGITTVGMPPAEHPGRCEFVVWINGLDRSTRWQNDAAFPQDPAGGTNMAFGIGINPPGQGLSSAFTLDLGADGFFEPRNEYDIRGFILDDYVGVFVPKSAAPSIGGVNFYSFCVEEGFSFDPSDTGSDQTGLIEMTPLDFGLVDIVLQSTTTTTTSTTLAETTTTIAETTTTPAPTTTVAETTTTVVASAPSTTGGGFPWGLVLGGGIVLALVGWWLYNRPEGDPCAELLEAWKAAQAKCESAETAATEAEDKCDDAKADVEDLEDERKELCREWPPACWEEGDDGGWIEDDQGNRVTSRDLHLRRQALGQIWSDYKSGKLSAQDVQSKWEEANNPEFREEMRTKDAAAKEELQDIEGDLTTARQAEKTACVAARTARTEADAACQAAEATKRAYEECVGKAAAAAGGASDGPSGGTDGGETGGQPGVGTGGPSGSQPDPCEGQPNRKVEADGQAKSTTVVVDFTMIVEAWAGSERNTEAGAQMTLDLQQVARELDLVGDLLSAREAGLAIGGGINGYAVGKYVSATGGVVKGGIGAVLAGADTKFDVPTSIPTAIVETLESLAKLGGIISGKVTEWMTNYQIMQARITYFTQRITATPYTVWECKPGVGWVCIERVWEFEVGRLRRRKGPKSRTFRGVSELGRWRMQREWERISALAANKVKRDAQALVKFRQEHRPGPCQ